MNIGNAMKGARMKAGLTQTEAAKQIGVSRQTLSNWENDRTLADVPQILMVSRVYHVTVEELLKGEPRIITVQKPTEHTPKRLYILLKVLPLIVFYLSLIVTNILAWRLDTGSSYGYLPSGWTQILVFSVLPIIALLITAWLTCSTHWKNGRWVALTVEHLLLALDQIGCFWLDHQVIDYPYRDFNIWGALQYVSGQAAVLLIVGVAIGFAIRKFRPRVSAWLNGSDEEGGQGQ